MEWALTLISYPDIKVCTDTVFTGFEFFRSIFCTKLIGRIDQAVHYFIKTLATKGFISIWYHHKCLIQLFSIHLNTYVMGLRPL